MKCKRCGRTIRGGIKSIGAHYRKFHAAVMRRGRKRGSKRSGHTGSGKSSTVGTGGYSKLTLTFHN